MIKNNEIISYYDASILLKKISDVYDIPYNELDYVLKLHVKNILNINYFNEETEQAFYWAGFIAADGCVYKKSLIISLAEKDKEHLLKFKTSIGCQTKLNQSITKHSLTNSKWKDSIKNTVRINSENIVESLKKFNIIPNKTLVYKFPKEIINHKYLNHYLRGYNDGDGSFYLRRSRKIVAFELRGTKEFLEDVSFVFKRDLDININVTTPDSTSKLKCQTLGYIPKLVDYLYKDATIFLERKYNIAKLCYSRELIGIENENNI